jgi:5-bromo-4-chloroindolyl phosphate hydrolysis protein
MTAELSQQYDLILSTIAQILLSSIFAFIIAKQHAIIEIFIKIVSFFSLEARKARVDIRG